MQLKTISFKNNKKISVCCGYFYQLQFRAKRACRQYKNLFRGERHFLLDGEQILEAWAIEGEAARYQTLLKELSLKLGRDIPPE